MSKTIHLTDKEFSESINIVIKLAPFDIHLIPIDELKQQYVDYQFQLPITNYSNIEYGQVDESMNITPIEPIISYLKGKYMLKEWQCYVTSGHNDIDVGLIVPNINMNIQIISDELDKYGYCIGASRDITVEDMNWTQLQFEPRETKSITDEIRNEKYLYHVTQTFNDTSILQYGIVPSNEDIVNQNQKYTSNRPSLVFLLRAYTELPQWMYIAKQLNNRRPNDLKTNQFSVFQIDVSKLPQNFEFYGDPQHPSGVSTPFSIPINAIELYTSFEI